MAEIADTTTMEAPTLTPAQLQAQLEQLKASATQQYSLKNYGAAAEFYSEAAEVQDQVNGEMSPDNSDLLYQYGRCLYHLGVSKSDVLGGKVAGNNNGSEEPKRKKRKTVAPVVAESSAAGADKTIADALKNGEQKLADVEEEKDEEDVKVEETAAAASSSKPFFQITGDENWTDSEEEDDDEDAGEGDEGEEEEEDDDFAIAYEILDVARVLLGRKLESLDANSPEARQVKERLADTHDLQAEIKLENEQFADAVTDAKSALSFKLQLYPQESGMIAEAHYKLAIALDFASLPVTSAEEEEQNGKASSSAPKEEPKVNEEMRAEAASVGIPTVIWSYPRGEAISKEGETAIDIAAYAAQIAALLGAHIIKIKLSTDALENKDAKKVYQEQGIDISTQAKRVEHCMQAAFGGRRIVVFSGGAAKGSDAVYEDAIAIRDGGGNGSIIGRNSFQRSREDALAMLGKLVDIYLGKA